MHRVGRVTACCADAFAGTTSVGRLAVFSYGHDKPGDPSNFLLPILSDRVDAGLTPRRLAPQQRIVRNDDGR